MIVYSSLCQCPCKCGVSSVHSFVCLLYCLYKTWLRSFCASSCMHPAHWGRAYNREFSCQFYQSVKSPRSHWSLRRRWTGRPVGLGNMCPAHLRLQPCLVWLNRRALGWFTWSIMVQSEADQRQEREVTRPVKRDSACLWVVRLEQGTLAGQDKWKTCDKRKYKNSFPETAFSME